MSINISTISSAGTSTYEVKVSLSSYDTISDPVAYVGSSVVYKDILAKAGLDENMYYIGAELTSTGMVGMLRTYYLNVQFSTEDGVNGGVGHTHTSGSLVFPLQAAYNDGSSIALSHSSGPIKISYLDDTTIDYFKITTDTDTTERVLFSLEKGSILSLGTHIKYEKDSEYDIGSSDGGSTKMRPRDVYIGRNIEAGGKGTFSSLSLSNSTESVDFGAGSVIGPTDASWTLHRMVKITINGTDTWICTYNHV